MVKVRDWPKRRLRYTLLGLVLLSAFVLVFLSRSGVSRGVYSVADVQAGLQANPKMWASRTVLVRGWTSGYSMSGCGRPAYGTAPPCRRYDAIYLSARPSINGDWPATELTLALRPGVSASYVDRLTTVGPLRGLFNVLHNLGPLGGRLFRWSGSETLRVCLFSPRPCAVRNSGVPNCSAGLLLGP